jgi:hypothetical protein
VRLRHFTGTADSAALAARSVAGYRRFAARSFLHVPDIEFRMRFLVARGHLPELLTELTMKIPALGFMRLDHSRSLRDMAISRGFRVRLLGFRVFAAARLIFFARSVSRRDFPALALAVHRLAAARPLFLCHRHLPRYDFP